MGLFRVMVEAERDRPHNARALLVGELNPHGPRPDFALFPAPRGCAGHNLCHRIMGLPEAVYLQHYARANLCTGEWRSAAAATMARELRATWARHDDARRTAGTLPHPWGTPFVLFGRKVARAFAVHDAAPFSVVRCPDAGRRLVVLPHPSGLCRVWTQQADAIDRARALLIQADVLPPSRPPGMVNQAPPVRCERCGEFTDSGLATECTHCGTVAE